jgi:glycosyltransferase involved in cell wall biosynthesis
MKILITTPIFPPEIGGPATYSLEVSRRLKARGHTVRIVTFADFSPDVEDLEIVAVRMSYPVLGSLLRQSRLFATMLRATRNMELIYAQGPVVVGLCSLIVGKLMRKPVVVKFVGDVAWEGAMNRGETAKLLEDFLGQPDGSLYTRLIKRIESFVFHHADRIITPSEYLKRVLIEYYKIPDARIEAVHNAVELNEANFVEEKKTKPGRPLVITAGRLVSWKGIDELIELVPSLVRKYPEFMLLVVGDGPEGIRLRDLCRKLGVESHVTFTGKLSHEETIAWLKNSDLFILNSRYEGLPHSVLEAMACRCPVLATGIDGTKEIIADDRNGITFAPGNRKQLEKKAMWLLEDESARKQMAERAYENVTSRFTWENTINQLEQVLRSTLS